jgi:hypothetical protein
MTDSKDAYPHDHGFAVNTSTPEAFSPTLTRVFVIPSLVRKL